MDIPAALLAPLKKEEKDKVLPNVVKGALILQVEAETPLWQVLERKKDAIKAHKKANTRIFWLACSSLEDESKHPTLIGNASAARIVIRDLNIKETKALGILVASSDQKAFARFQQVQKTSNDIGNAQNMNDVIKTLNETDYGKELLNTLKTDWFFE
jgi:hypothetical protein